MPILALLLAAAASPQTPRVPVMDTRMCIGPCPILPDPHLRPLAFLAGSCWRTTNRMGGMVDTYCYTWMYGGRFLRERNTTIPENYGGETIYHWDSATRQIRWEHYSSGEPWGPEPWPARRRD